MLYYSYREVMNVKKISEEGMKSLMTKMAQIAQEQMDPEVTGLMEAPITTSFVKHMTKVRDMGDVIARNDQLSKTYQGFLNLYGFDRMYDMYLYAMSNDVFPEEILKSDTSSEYAYVPITRTVTRNGEPLEVTITESIEKAEKKPTKKKPAAKPGAKPGEEEEEPPIPLARELKGTTHGQDGPIDPKKVAKLKQRSGKMPRGNQPFNEGSDFYFELHGPDGKPAGIAGFSEEKGHLKMDFFVSNGEVHGVATRAFFELVKLALKKEKGVKMDDHFEARPLFSNSGLEQKKAGHWEIDGKKLAENYGQEPKKKS
jgi:hypothetical protein